MGRITRALSALAERIKADRGAYDINEMEHLQPLGDDSRPLPQDDGWSDRTSQNGVDVYLGAFDYDNKIADPGEKRTYARNDAGEVVNHVYLKKDGTIIIANDSYSKTINPDGSWVETNGAYSKSVNADGSYEETNGNYNKSVATSGLVNINGFIINPDGSATSPVSVGAPVINGSSSLTVAGKEQKDHVHAAGSYLDAEGRPITGNSGSQP
ncbi:hypothetical protein NVP1158O_27 [Vibrio phage 1.158.O._10N.261.45.E12]|nr:hypothetical protein NVP1158O_27 [Vibrio phage 1.158.O._10N.261.45.E12]AUR92656.1 hypothetical protein NVP1175O_28 [Vibrio phage 1.175.O._10N.261.55.B3]